jgi:hypothetical protein
MEGENMKKAKPKKDQAAFEQKVAELGAALKKLPADRQEQLERTPLDGVIDLEERMRRGEDVSDVPEKTKRALEKIREIAERLH